VVSQRFHPLDRVVGGRIRHLRRRLGVSQAELAEAVGLSYQQIQKYETGASRICVSTLILIARRLNAPVAALLLDL
jgi:transcriptional regulator with XRE-family HTH domain